MDITGLGSIFDFGSKVIDKVFPNPEQKAAALLELEKLKQSGELAQLAADTELAKGQMAINQVEAASSNLFVSGARPFIMWTCGVAFAYSYVVQPFLIFFISVYGYKVDAPQLDLTSINNVIWGVLGLGGTMRTIEKVKGVTK